MASKCISSPAGIVAEGTFEGLLARVQLDVAQEVALLGEGGTTLIAMERPLTWKEEHHEWVAMILAFI